MMNKKDKALRVAAKAFMIIQHGGFLTPSQAKTFCDSCCLALPMKYRFPRAELDAIKAGVERAAAEQRAEDEYVMEKRWSNQPEDGMG